MKHYKLNELGTVNRGKSKHRPRNDPELYGGKYPFIQTGDVKHSSFYVTSHTQTYNEKGLAQSKLWEKGTLCITIAANIADTAILSYPACFPDSIIGFLPNKKKADVKYVKYCLDTFRLQMQSISQGTTQDNMSLEKLLSIGFPAPDLESQRKIAGILSAYDDLIENNKRRIALLENMAEELYREWFVRFRFPGWRDAEFEKGIPKGWELQRVDSLGKIITGKTPLTSNEKYYLGNIHFIKTPDMHGNMFIYETEENLTEDGLNSQPSQMLPKNAISVSCIGTGGITSITTQRCCTNQQINSIVLKNENDLEWAFYTVKGLKETIYAFGSTGTTMTNLSKGKFSGLKFICAPKYLREPLKTH
ncbi:restriction endonuclease subunit S [Thiothrix winogradskyi]|uniref:Restriction endonuclease subunit S n=1 Tax=Thiothrix winogradskyi TaxID=96472 RepID=A0ABY3T162_9GAMM|nr:restriction endonuclease subunit S [Thiothrix winogradskyi]UJS25543.1 restriction endonuclease subunit S [Thiothrix winogradskyi]